MLTRFFNPPIPAKRRRRTLENGNLLTRQRANLRSRIPQQQPILQPQRAHSILTAIDNTEETLALLRPARLPALLLLLLLLL